MRTMFRFPWRRQPVGHGVVGVVRRSDGLGLVHLFPALEGDRPLLALCLFQPAVQEPSRVLAEWVRQHGLEKARFVGLLDRSGYQLFPADIPALPREEWALNLRWKIADRIPYPAEQAVLELFALPGTPQGESGKLYVAVAQDRVVQQAVDLFLDAGLPLSSLDILDLALGRLTDRLPEDGQGVALLYWTGESGVVTVRRHRTLYLARAIESRWQAVLAAMGERGPPPSSGAPHPVLDALAESLQRTFRFYENTFSQPPLEHLFVVPMGEVCRDAAPVEADLSASGYEWRVEPAMDLPPVTGRDPATRLLAALSERLGMRAHWLPLERVLRSAPGVREGDLRCCLPAIGAALGGLEA